MPSLNSHNSPRDHQIHIHMNAVLEVEGLEQRLSDSERPEQFVVRVPDRLVVMPGDFVAMLGPSGCGKTTLLTVLGLLRAPTDASSIKTFRLRVQENGANREIDLAQLWRRRAQSSIEGIRRRFIGFALQSGELLPALTVRENIEAPLRLNGWASRLRASRVDHLISAFGLKRARQESNGVSGKPNGDIYDLGMARVNKLSGGEYQRVSLARSIAHEPQLIFVDEPTAALNRELARGALQEFRNLLDSGRTSSAAIMITHDEQLAEEFATLIVRMAPLKNEPGGSVVDISRINC